MVVEFIEGWNLHHILGEGTFGEVTFFLGFSKLHDSYVVQVKLLVNKENGEACAMKEVRMANLLILIDQRLTINFVRLDTSNFDARQIWNDYLYRFLVID